jgi:hypothetical protein
LAGVLPGLEEKVIKDLIRKQVVCDEKDAKGKPCHGGLKRYHPFSSYYNEEDKELLGQIKSEFGQDPKLVLLKCQECKTVYRLPDTLKERYG